MAKTWSKFLIRLDPSVHYTLMQLCPNPTLAVRHLVNLYVKQLAQAKYKDGAVPPEFNIDLEEIERDDRNQ